MASPLFQISSDGGGSYLAVGTAAADANALAYNASSSYSIKARLDSTTGVEQVSWVITSADDAHVASLPTVTTNNDKTCTFSLPKQGGAWLLKCTINGGISLLTGDTDPALTSSLAIKVLNASAKQEIAVGETTEAGTYGYTKAWNDIARSSGLGPDFGASTVKATKLQGTSGAAFNTGLITKSIAAGGTIVLGTGSIEAHTIELTGAAASNVLLQFPATVGARWTVVNLSTDNAKKVILDDGGAGILLPPGSSRVVGIGTAGTLVAADGKGFGFEFQKTIAGAAVGNNDTTLMVLPSGYLLTEAYSFVKVAPTDGTSVVHEAMGVSDESIMNSTPATGAAGTARGVDTATDYGSGMSAFGALLAPSDKVLTHRHAVTVATAAGMILVVTLTGKRLTA